MKNLQGSIAIILVIMLSACQTMAPDFDKPEIQVTSIKLIAPENNDNALNINMKFDIGLYVTNPNSQALNIQGMTYDIRLGDSANSYKVISGISNNIPEIEGYGDASFSTTATLNLFSGIKFFADFLQQKSLETLPYSIKAKLDTGIPLIGKVTVTEDGEVNLKTKSSAD